MSTWNNIQRHNDQWEAMNRDGLLGMYEEDREGFTYMNEFFAFATPDMLKELPVDHLRIVWNLAKEAYNKHLERLEGKLNLVFVKDPEETQSPPDSDT